MIDHPAELVTIILFLCAQTGAFLFWAGRITQEQTDHARRLADLESTVRQHTLDMALHAGRRKGDE